MERVILLVLICIITNEYNFAAGNQKLVAELLKSINEKSLTILINKSETKSMITAEQQTALIFNTKGYLQTSYSNTDSPQTSPFSTSNSTNLEYGLGVEKQWESGLNTKLSYKLQDRENTFFSGVNNSFLAPTVELNVTTNLIQDVLHKRYFHMSEKSKFNIQAFQISNIVDQKEVLTKGLLSFSNIVEKLDELKLQQSLCSYTKKQNKKLENKFERRSIPKREYLLSSKEYMSCQINIEQLNKSLTELQDDFEITYGFTYDSFKKLDSQMIYDDLETSYKKLKSSNQKIDINKKDEILAIASQIKALEAKQFELRALAKSDLALEMRAGATGLDDSFGDSHDGVGDLSFPFLYVGLKLGIPFSDPIAKSNVAAGAYKLEALEYRKRQVLNQSQKRFKTLESTLENDFKIYKKYFSSIDLSEAILKEARRDFDNGRIDYRAMTEFNKNLITEQQKLSAHRSLLLVRLIEYLDYYQFFNQYFQG